MKVWNKAWDEGKRKKGMNEERRTTYCSMK
jgi:hypothetical protein